MKSQEIRQDVHEALERALRGGWTAKRIAEETGIAPHNIYGFKKRSCLGVDDLLRLRGWLLANGYIGDGDKKEGAPQDGLLEALADELTGLAGQLRLSALSYDIRVRLFVERIAWYNSILEAYTGVGRISPDSNPPLDLPRRK